MAVTFKKKTEKILSTNAKARKLLGALAVEHGEDRVYKVWSHWLDHRDIAGLRWPIGKFLEEFNSTSAAMGNEPEVDLEESNRIINENLARKHAREEAEHAKQRAQEEYEKLHEDELFGPPAPLAHQDEI
jgi:hypothetical protein